MPNTEKNTSTDGNTSVVYAVSTMEGWRSDMEDEYAAILDVKNSSGKIVGNYFGVFDGHGGALLSTTFCLIS